jgi:hypothetical protein
MVNLTIFYNFENKYEFFVFSSENHVFNEIHMNVKIDKWQFVKLRRTFFFSIAALISFLVIYSKHTIKANTYLWHLNNIFALNHQNENSETSSKS